MAASNGKQSNASTPRTCSRSSSARSKLSLDLSNLPPVTVSSPPSNTLLITNLDLTEIFLPENLATLRNLINTHVKIHTWSPLKSMRRIIVSFYDVESAKLVKDTLDGEIVMDCRAIIYYGVPTDISPPAQHLEAPRMDKLFFISPPPSPPHDWEMRNEEPPNTNTHAEDLAHALARLHATTEGVAAAKKPMEEITGNRIRSSSITLVYHPEHHGNNPGLPAISVEDTDVMVESPTDNAMESMFCNSVLRTERPPVDQIAS